MLLSAVKSLFGLVDWAENMIMEADFDEISFELIRDIVSRLGLADVREVGFENFIVISPLVFTKDEIENSPLRVSPIVKNIVAEGVAI